MTATPTPGAGPVSNRGSAADPDPGLGGGPGQTPPALAEPLQVAVHDAVASALAEDVGALGDITSALLEPGAPPVEAVLVARQAGVLAGRLPAEEAFGQVGGGVTVAWAADDGDELVPGRPFATIRGPLAPVLTAERTALNFLGHLSGIATLTRRFVDAARSASPTVAIRDTRKTTPGLRALEKAAVVAGGGRNHRWSLSDAVLLKDNHLALLTVAGGVAAARQRWPGRAVEVECDTPEQCDEAVAAGVDAVLLDNMTPAEVAECVARVGGALLVEVSGGITLDDVAAYAATGVAAIAVGALTHSAPALDIGLDVSGGA